MEALEISFIIPCYNAGVFLREAVASIERQKGTFRITEILIVDDRSDDPVTLEVLGAVAGHDLVRVLTNTGPRGAGNARNTGLGHATGEWIAFMDGDDVLLDDSLELRCRAARAFPDCKWISADYIVLNPDGTTEEKSFYSSRPLPQRYFQEAFLGKKPIRLRRPVGAFIDCCLSKIGANLIHRDLISRVGGFDPELFMSEDHQYYIRLAQVSDMIFVPEPALLYRRHATNTTNADVPPGLWPNRSLAQLAPKYNIDNQRDAIRAKMSYYHLMNAFHFRRKHLTSPALRESLAAIRYAPASLEAWRCLIGSALGR